MKKFKASVLALLVQIVAFGEQGGYVAKSKELDKLVADKLVQLGPDGDNNTVAVRSLPEGVEASKQPAAAPRPAVDPNAPKPSFTLAANVPVPQVKRGGNTGKSIYPFEQMEVGQSFFIPASAQHPEPWKSLASTATSATRRYDELLKNADGSPLMENYTDKKTKEVKQRQQRKHTRVFAMREIADGAPWGQPGVKGAGVFRTA